MTANVSIAGHEETQTYPVPSAYLSIPAVHAPMRHANTRTRKLLLQDRAGQEDPVHGAGGRLWIHGLESRHVPASGRHPFGQFSDGELGRRCLVCSRGAMILITLLDKHD